MIIVFIIFIIIIINIITIVTLIYFFQLIKLFICSYEVLYMRFGKFWQSKLYVNITFHLCKDKISTVQLCWKQIYSSTEISIFYIFYSLQWVNHWYKTQLNMSRPWVIIMYRYHYTSYINTCKLLTNPFHIVANVLLYGPSCVKFMIFS